MRNRGGIDVLVCRLVGKVSLRKGRPGGLPYLAALIVTLAHTLHPDTPAVSFEDVTERSGIASTLRNGATPEKHQIETMAGGIAAFDYDGDGLIDLFLTNGARQPDLTKPDPGWWNRLYRNRGQFGFEDVTAKSGLRGEGFAMGAAAGDYDNDGHTDLFVAGVRGNLLYRNRGDGTFLDVTSKAGIHAEPWSVAAGWFDYDGDGRLDLFVVNYVQWDPAKEPACIDSRSGERAHCHPRMYTGLPNTLYRNNGDGTFTDVSDASGIRHHIGKGMSVAFADYDGDGRPDIFVTNDTEPNFLFHNDGNGRFTEVGVRAGVAFNDDGRAVSSMGIDFRDIDNDGRPDVFLTALVNETYPLYRNLGKGLFADITYRSRVGAATAKTTGWAAGIFDFNNDGRKDIFCANGDLNENAEALSQRPSRQPNVVLVQRADGTFDPVTAGPAARYRGAAFADFDNDGRLDIAVTRLGEKPLLLRNTSGASNHWLGFKLEGRRGNRDAIGAIVHVTAGGVEQWNHVSSAVGYASASDTRVHFGLGAARAGTVEIQWPGGALQKLGEVAADRYLVVREP
jgi:enediyne biosynthesis protein E4